jgi:pimeloyl-ACP methyl ester carboxylesterase
MRSMTIQSVHLPQRQRGERVIALHCSGGGAGQWCTLARMLGGGYEVATPEHYGCESVGPWGGAHAFALADEAARTLALIDEAGTPVHLVGHSYGGGVALNAALARPDRIASMALYEPSAFHLLRQMGEEGAAAHAEIVGIVRRVCEGVVTGDYRGAMAAFVDYWSGPGAWSLLRPTVQAALIRWAPKAPLDFRALIDEGTQPAAYGALPFPVLILRGERAPAPTRLIAERLAQLVPAARLEVLDRAGHMGPVTHAAEVSGEIARHIAGAAAATGVGTASGRWPRDLAGAIGAAARPARAVS